MPGGDRTGPMGMGSMTGWGSGYCSGVNRLGHPGALPWRGNGMGAGRGGGSRRAVGGRGWRNQYYATGQPGWLRRAHNGGLQGQEELMTTDKAALRQRAQILQAQLEAINTQLDEMEQGTGNGAQ